MTVALRGVGSGRALRLRFLDWASALELAAYRGWNPTGEVASSSPGGRTPFEILRDGPANGERNIILAADAEALADAIEGALPDLPDHACAPSGGWFFRDGLAAVLHQLSGASSKKRLRALAAFCRESGGIAY